MRKKLLLSCERVVDGAFWNPKAIYFVIQAIFALKLISRRKSPTMRVRRQKSAKFTSQQYHRQEVVYGKQKS